MPALGSPFVREMRRLAAAYHAFPGDRDAPREEVLAWFDRHEADDVRSSVADEPNGDGSGAIDRRELLRRGAAVGAVTVGASILGRSLRASATGRDEPNVVIVGAGLAGLTCAYRLTTNGIRPVVHEAQERLGGRCFSIVGFFEQDQTAEHGGQYIDSRHRQIRRLAAELGVPLVDTFAQSFPAGSQDHRWLDGALRSPDEIFADFGVFIRRLERDYARVGSYFYDQAGPAAERFDRMMMIEWFDRRLPGGSGSLLGLALGVFMQSFFGMEPSEMSAVNLFEAFVVPYPGANERYRVAGGNDRVVRALHEALPAGMVRRGSVLEAAWTRRDGRIGLRFSDGRADVIADRVVFALPFTTLREVDLSGLRLSSRRRRAIAELAMGTNAKLNMQFDRAFARFDWGAGFSSDEPHYVTWDTTYGQKHPAPRTPVLTVYNGGVEGATYPTNVAHAPASREVIRQTLANLERGVVGISKAFNGKAFLDSWVDDPWARGSYAGFGPGQYTSYWGFLERNEGRAYFAGEHTSTHSQGYLNGGVESGQRAANQVRTSLRG
jgi:monoamine oxidase